MDITNDYYFTVDAKKIGLGRKDWSDASHNLHQTFFGDFTALKQVVLHQINVQICVHRVIREHSCDAQRNARGSLD